MQTSYLLVLLLMLLAVTLVTSHRGRWRGGRRRGWNRRRGHRGRGGRGEKGGGRGQKEQNKVIACEFKNSTATETLVCPAGSTCTNPSTGPLTVQSNGETVTFKFCNISYIPQYTDACNVTHLNGATMATPVKCPSGVSCDAGPLQSRKGKRRRFSTVNLYFCGTEIPKEPNYGHFLSQKSCAINGIPTRRCKRWKPCNGANISMVINNVNTTLTFCYGQDDPGFYYVNLWRKCRGSKCKVTTIKHSSPTESADEAENDSGDNEDIP